MSFKIDVLQAEQPHSDALALWPGLAERIRTLYPMIFRFIRSRGINEKDAEDLTQGVFIKLVDNRDSILKMESLNIWCFRVARNSVLDFLRSKSVKEKYICANPEIADAIGEFQAANDFSPAEIVEKGDTVNFVRSHLIPLSETILDLSSAGLTFEEIGLSLGLPTTTIQSKYKVIINRLRVMMNEERAGRYKPDFVLQLYIWLPIHVIEDSLKMHKLALDSLFVKNIRRMHFVNWDQQIPARLTEVKSSGRSKASVNRRWDLHLHPDEVYRSLPSKVIRKF